MKKTYIAPALKVKKIHIPSILAGSPDSINDSQGYSEQDGGYAKESNGFNWGNPEEESGN